MADGFDNLGKASLDLTARTVEFERNIAGAHKTAEGMESQLDALAAVSRIAEEALQRVKMSPGQGAESKASAEGILSGVRGISEEARDAARELDRVKLTSLQAAESDAAGDVIDRKLKSINRNANETRRALDRVKIAGGVPGRSGVGVGIFGSGFGRVGLLGAAVGAGTVLGPAAGPGAAGLLAAVPTLAFGAAGAVGTLALAFDGVGKALKGDKKAFDDLGPSAQKFVLTIRSLDGWFDKLKETAAGSLFPGLTAGLKAALSPGTTGAITTGVAQFGRAIGQAGAQWGRYFGSAKFQQLLGPLMQAGAQNFVRLSDALLHIFDALAVLGRAAIPFTAWITRSIDHASQFASKWLRAKEATGQLGHAMDEAKTSLRLVGGLFVSLLRVVGALGRALYPVSKVAVKALTDGLNALARIIQRNQQGIREIVGGALAALVSTVKIAAPIVGALARALSRVVHAVGGWKTAFEIVISGFLATKFVGLVGSVGKFVTALKEARLGALALGGPEVLAALAAFWAFKHFGGPGITPDVPTAPTVVSKFSLVAPRGTSLATDIAAIKAGKKLSKGQTVDVINAFKRGDLTGGAVPTKKDIATLIDDLEHPGKGLPVKRKPVKELATGSHAWWIKNYGYDPGDASKGGDVFGKPPPFDKNVKADTFQLPIGLRVAEAKANSTKSLADDRSVARREIAYLDRVIPKLPHGDKLIAAYDALAAARSRIEGVEKKKKKVVLGGALNLALDTAKLAVESATVGTAAYDKAVKAEAKALRAEISFWDRRALNVKLSRAARDKALREELAYKRELKSLLKPEAAGAAGANEAQFLSSFKQIIGAFAPNAFPQQSGGKTDTHLYDLVHETRQSNAYLRRLVSSAAFPASGYGIESDLAVAG